MLFLVVRILVLPVPAIGFQFSAFTLLVWPSSFQLTALGTKLFQIYDQTMGGMYLCSFVQFHVILQSIDSSALLSIQAQLHTLLPGCKLHCQCLQPNCTHV